MRQCSVMANLFERVINYINYPAITWWRKFSFTVNSLYLPIPHWYLTSSCSAYSEWFRHELRNVYSQWWKAQVYCVRLSICWFCGVDTSKELRAQSVSASPVMQWYSKWWLAADWKLCSANSILEISNLLLQFFRMASLQLSFIFVLFVHYLLLKSWY